MGKIGNGVKNVKVGRSHFSHLGPLYSVHLVLVVEKIKEDLVLVVEKIKEDLVLNEGFVEKSLLEQNLARLADCFKAYFVDASKPKI